LRRCARIEAFLARVLEIGPLRATDLVLAASLRRHAWQDERHAEALRALTDESRLPREESRAEADLRGWLEQLFQARSEIEALAGIYGVAKVVLADAYRDLIAAADPTRDHRLLSLLEDLLHDEETDLEWGLEELRRRAADPAAREEADDWAEFLRRGLRAAGDIWGDMPRGVPPSPPRRRG
jgi:hypothetical protein